MSPPVLHHRRLLQRIAKLLFALAIAVIVTPSSLLFGHLVHPSDPIKAHLSMCSERPEYARKTTNQKGDLFGNELSFNRECPANPFYQGYFHHFYLKCRLAIASTLFCIATSLRTMIMTPLIQLESKSNINAISSFVDGMESLIVDGMERYAHDVWEDIAQQSGLLSGRPSLRGYRGSGPSPYKTPEIDLRMLVPCNHNEAWEYLLESSRPQIGGSSAHIFRLEEDSPNVCRLRDIITHKLLVDYAKTFCTRDFDLTTHPIILRYLWPEESLHDHDGNTYNTYRRLTPKGIMTDPELSNLVLPNHFSDSANRTGYAALVPDNTTEITLSQFVGGLLSGETPNAKIGTQVIIDQIPELRDEIIPPTLAKELFGWSTYLEDVKESIRARFGAMAGDWIHKIPPMSYYPVFIARNHERRDDLDTSHPRTDLHTEPIGNIATQLHGVRRWTLVPTEWSALLRPTVSKHRGYFYSNMDPLLELPERLSQLPVVYNCVTFQGDAIWIPPWMWHRVDYNSNTDGISPRIHSISNDNKCSIGASIFHFYPKMFVQNFPLFSFLIIPNFIQEALGFNIE